MAWILAVCTGNKIAIYLGDISGAFDRVFTDYLLAKLQAAGVGSQYLNFLEAYLQPRAGTIVVEGVCSEEFQLANTVFQGTVLGPPLWNVFFSDVTHCISTEQPALFADDLTVFQQFKRTEENESIKRHMHVCRTRVHKWGRANRVAFDPTKEHVVVIHPIYGEGDPFKLLGCLVDCKLVMDQAVEKILSQMRPKIRAIVRTKPHYSTRDLVGQFKTHIWGTMEVHSGGIFHASNHLLDKFDASQRHFLEELGIDERSAFLDYNFAPPSLRRNIGILGLLHKRVLGIAHPIFNKLLPYHLEIFGSLRQGEHNKQLYGHGNEIHFQHGLHRRSIFGMVHIYNRLPQEIVDCACVSSFQRELTLIARKKCEGGNPDWSFLFSGRA